LPSAPRPDMRRVCIPTATTIRCLSPGACLNCRQRDGLPPTEGRPRHAGLAELLALAGGLLGELGGLPLGLSFRLAFQSTWSWALAAFHSASASALTAFHWKVGGSSSAGSSSTGAGLGAGSSSAGAGSSTTGRSSTGAGVRVTSSAVTVTDGSCVSSAEAAAAPAAATMPATATPAASRRARAFRNDDM
jgi:hypothetical protein